MSDALASIPVTVLAKLDEIAASFDALEKSLTDPDILADHRKVRDLSIKKAAMEPVVVGYRRFRALTDEAAELRIAIQSGEDPEFAELARQELPQLEADAADLFEQVKAKLVTADDRKVGSIMLELRAGTGGDEAGLWAQDLMTMYEKYAGRRGWKFDPMEIAADDGLGGLRHAVINVQGEGVWAELAFEAGVHSVKRVPVTESQGRIHTSTATVAVLPEPEEIDITIDWGNDVDEHITTAQGPGGQNVNKVATAIHLRHKPTGVEVRMQETKSQAQNREKARRLLAARVYEIEREKVEAERAAERRGQIGAGARSEKIRTYRYQEGIVVDQRLEERFNLQKTLDGDLGPMVERLIEQETARRLAEL